MSEEELNEAIEFNLEYMEAMQSEEIFGGDYTSFVELKYANKEIERLQQENQQLKEKIDKAIDKIQLIIDLGFDYDGFNQVDSLKGLINELVSLARESRNILKGEDK